MNNIIILAEKQGETERLFKNKLIDVLQKSTKRVRAYLALVQYGTDPETHVALLLKTPTGNDETLLSQCQQVFIAMFSTSTHLDTIFIDDELETRLRKICVPFYTSPDFNVMTPDFYLYSHDVFSLSDVVRHCYMRARLYSDEYKNDDFILCDIEPILSGEVYHLKQKAITQLILSNKWVSYKLYPVTQWPLPIRVFCSLKDTIVFTDKLNSSNSILTAWAEIYDRKDNID